ncbi:hypothetical protein MesoLj113a_44890 [Mesorhizobium sp. 113-1-2]|nr:hypothetical protein MesoLj113a_44890 [Mesorhizobium sp. 113-1-2]
MPNRQAVVDIGHSKTRALAPIFGCWKKADADLALPVNQVKDVRTGKDASDPVAFYEHSRAEWS